MKLETTDRSRIGPAMGGGDPVPPSNRKYGVVLMASWKTGASSAGHVLRKEAFALAARPTVASPGVSRSPLRKGKERVSDQHAAHSSAIKSDPPLITVVLSPYCGRVSLTATLFVNSPQGRYTRSPIVLIPSEDGRLT